MYRRLTRDRVDLRNQIDGGKSEYIFKAFVGHDHERNLVPNNLFYDNGPLRDKRGSCS
jgi:hypothetical protein